MCYIGISTDITMISAAWYHQDISMISPWFQQDITMISPWYHQDINRISPSHFKLIFTRLLRMAPTVISVDIMVISCWNHGDIMLKSWWYHADILMISSCWYHGDICWYPYVTQTMVSYRNLLSEVWLGRAFVLKLPWNPHIWKPLIWNSHF